MENTGHLLSWVIFLPLAGAVIIAFIRESASGGEALIRWIAIITTVADFLISLPLLTGFDRTTPAMQFVERASWVPAFNVQYAVGVDGISLLLVLLTTLLSPLCVLCSWKVIENKLKEFMMTLLIMETAMLGVFAALDFVLFYVFWETMLIPMYLIIGVWGGPQRIYAAIKFFLYTLAGSLLLLVAILVLYFAGGRTFDIQALMGQGYSPTVQFWVFWAFFLAFAIKVPMFPFHTWLPDAHVEAPTAGSVFLASVLLKMGTYGFLRFCLPMVPQASVAFAPLILWLSVISIVYGAFMAIAQRDLKKLIAYSSVSHMGFATLGIFIFNIQGMEGALLQMINHGITTGALFLSVGQVYDRIHSRLLADFAGLSKSMPLYATSLTIFSFASLGLPGTNNFVGEFLILVGSFLHDKFFATLVILGVVLTSVYMLWVVREVVFGSVNREGRHSLPDLDLREIVIMLPLVALVFWVGLHPKPLLDVMHVSVSHLVGQVHGAQPIQISEVLKWR